MTKALSYIGQQSRYILLLALVLAALLPSVSSALRPLLPVLVSLVLGLSIARLDIASVLLEYKDIKRLVLLLGVVLTFIPLTAFLLVYGWRLLGFNENYTLLLVVFAGAPPLGSATALSLLLGYNARITLQVTLLATVLTPFLGPMCLALIGVSIDASLSSVAMNIFLMIAGGFALGLVLQRVIGKQRIANNPDVFNGFATIGMVCSLFPLFDHWAKSYKLCHSKRFGLNVRQSQRGFLSSSTSVEPAAEYFHSSLAISHVCHACYFRQMG